MVATLYIYVPLHCYHSAAIDPTLVHTLLKHLVCDTISYKENGTSVKTNKYDTKCKLTIAMTNK